MQNEILHLGTTPQQTPGGAVSEADGNVHTIPMYGPDHAESAECWCKPELVADETENGGVKCYLHKEIQ